MEKAAGAKAEALNRGYLKNTDHRGQLGVLVCKVYGRGGIIGHTMRYNPSGRTRERF